MCFCIQITSKIVVSFEVSFLFFLTSVLCTYALSTAITYKHADNAPYHTV